MIGYSRDSGRRPLEDIKAKLKPKKAAISLEMLDTANTYDDKVAVIRRLSRRGRPFERLQDDDAEGYGYRLSRP